MCTCTVDVDGGLPTKPDGGKAQDGWDEPRAATVRVFHMVPRLPGRTDSARQGCTHECTPCDKLA